MVAVEGPNHVIRYANPDFAKLAQTTTVDFLGHRFIDVVPELAGNDCMSALARVLRTGSPEFLLEPEHHLHSPKSWSYVMWAILGTSGVPSGVMIQLADATEAAALRRKSTAMIEALLLSAIQQHELIDTIRQGELDRRELETQMFQAKKLESLGVLAEGIAHDLNNTLTPVLGFAELAADGLPTDSIAVPMLDAVRANVRRATKLVQQIMAYSGKGRYVIGPVDLSRLVEEMTDMLREIVSRKIDLRYALASPLPLVEADATHLRQVIINLVTNAFEAIGEAEGTISVRTGVLPAGQRTYETPNDAVAPLVFMEVADSGLGIPADIIDKIFDPFFTTKFTGRGLGLAVVQGIARAHRGSIQVRSSPGEGSSFCLLLPSSTTLLS
jgi:signal transduction histidine kinase